MFVERTQTICPHLCHDRDQMGSGRGQSGPWSVIFSVPVIVRRQVPRRAATDHHMPVFSIR
jgi:hypothetical protein